MKRFEDKSVLITGGSRGIGKGLALRFAREGANVAVAANEDAVHPVAEEIHRSGGRAISAICDVTNKGEVDKLFDRVIGEFGTLDVSIQNAGVITIAKIEDLTEQEWDKIMAVDNKGVFFCFQAAAGRVEHEEFFPTINKAVFRTPPVVFLSPPFTP